MRRPCYHSELNAIALAAALFFLGCSATPHPAFDDSELRLPRALVSHDSFLLDVAFVQLPDARSESDDVWSQLDEQAFDTNLRRRLAENGIRVGLLRGQLPAALRVRSDSPTERTPDQEPKDEGERKNLDIELKHRTRRMQLRPGMRGEIVSGEPQDELVVLCKQENGICGETYSSAQPVCIVEADNDGSGGCIVNLTPVIKFGQARERFIGSEGAFRREARQDEKRFESLRIESPLTPGQTLVVAPTGPGKSIGGAFFRQVTDGDTSRVLLVRLSRAPGDPLFSEIAGENIDSTN